MENFDFYLNIEGCSLRPHYATNVRVFFESGKHNVLLRVGNKWKEAGKFDNLEDALKLQEKAIKFLGKQQEQLTALA